MYKLRKFVVYANVINFSERTVGIRDFLKYTPNIIVPQRDDLEVKHWLDG